MTLILGIDPGTQFTGYGLIQKLKHALELITFGVIKTDPKMALEKRYLKIYQGIEQVIELYAPDEMVVESQFLGKNVQSALKLGMAKGVILLAAAKHNIPIFEYAPRKAKQSVVGSGSASKEQVQKMLKLLLNTETLITPEDAADGVALALCHAQQKRELWHV